jgi:hypothetical protein
VVAAALLGGEGDDVGDEGEAVGKIMTDGKPPVEAAADVTGSRRLARTPGSTVELAAAVGSPIPTVVVFEMTTVITAEVVGEVGEAGSRRLAKMFPVVPTSLGDESPASESDNDLFVDDDERTSCGVSVAGSCEGGFVMVVLWKLGCGRLIARGK